MLRRITKVKTPNTRMDNEITSTSDRNLPIKYKYMKYNNKYYIYYGTLGCSISKSTLSTASLSKIYWAVSILYILINIPPKKMYNKRRLLE